MVSPCLQHDSRATIVLVKLCASSHGLRAAAAETVAASSGGRYRQSATTGFSGSSRTDSSLHRSEMHGTMLKSAVKNPRSVQPRPCTCANATQRYIVNLSRPLRFTHTGAAVPTPRATSRECYQLQLYTQVNLQPQFREFRRKMCKLYRHVRAASRGGLGW